MKCPSKEKDQQKNIYSKPPSLKSWNFESQHSCYSVFVLCLCFLLRSLPGQRVCSGASEGRVSWQRGPSGLSSELHSFSPTNAERLTVLSLPLRQCADTHTNDPLIHDAACVQRYHVVWSGTAGADRGVTALWLWVWPYGPEQKGCVYPHTLFFPVPFRTHRREIPGCICNAFTLPRPRPSIGRWALIGPGASWRLLPWEVIELNERSQVSRAVEDHQRTENRTLSSTAQPGTGDWVRASPPTTPQSKVVFVFHTIKQKHKNLKDESASCVFFFLFSPVKRLLPPLTEGNHQQVFLSFTVFLYNI